MCSSSGLPASAGFTEPPLGLCLCHTDGMSIDSDGVNKTQQPPKGHPMKRNLFVIALIILAVLPTIPLSMTSLGPVGSGGGVLGTVVAVLAVRTFGVGKGALVGLFTALTLSFAPLGLNYPALGTMLMVILGAACGLAVYEGKDGPFVMLGLFVGITMIMPSPLTLDQIENGVTVTSNYILVLTGLMLLSTAWGILLGWLLLLKLPRAPVVPVQRELAMTYGATLALLGGMAAAVALTWFPNTAAGWVILTIYVIVIPRAVDDKIVHEMRIKAVHRVTGTIVGVAIAGLLAAAIRNPIPLYVLGIICVIVAVELRFAGQPYWRYVIFLTPGVVFLTGYGMDADRFGLMRLACTVIGAAVSLGALEIIRRYTVPWIMRSRERDTAELAELT